MNYGDLIKDAFWLTLRNRYLWFFGFFAGGTSVGGGNFSFPSGGPSGFDDDDFDDFGEPQVRAISVAPWRASIPANGYPTTSL
jgi:hypothetical protein